MILMNIIIIMIAMIAITITLAIIIGIRTRIMIQRTILALIYHNIMYVA